MYLTAFGQQSRIYAPGQIGAYNAADRTFLSVNNSGVVDFRSLENIITVGSGLNYTSGTLSVDFGVIPGDGRLNAVTVTTSNNTRTLNFDMSTGVDPSVSFNVNDSDANPENEAQTLIFGGTTNPTIALSNVGAVTGGTVTFVGAGGLTFSRSGGTITATAPAADGNNFITGLTFTGTGATRSYTITRQGLADLTGSINVNDADSDPLNERNVLGRVTTTNTVTATNSGGSVSIIPLVDKLSASFVSSGNSVTLPAPTVGPVPTEAQILAVIRNGIEQDDPFNNGYSFNNSTRVLSHATITFAATETLKIVYFRLN